MTQPVSQVDAIREYWSFCGEIEDLDVMRFPDTGRFKGIAFITYAAVRRNTRCMSLLLWRQGALWFAGSNMQHDNVRSSAVCEHHWHCQQQTC